MRELIQTKLAEIEPQFDVKILYACESGSRAWGFPSADSDYDVRFLYIHPTEWYLTVNLEKKRDVIELPINDQLDISGWDLRKALQLFRKSNPPLLEWLGSPIIYKEPFTVAQQMRELAQTYYSPTACMYHYLHMARGNYREYLHGETVWIKKYFYVLRPILAIMWLEKELGVVPTEFTVLAQTLLADTPLLRAIERLIEAKKDGAELDYGPRIPEISDFVAEKLTLWQDARFAKKRGLMAVDPMNDLFQNALKEVW